MKNRSLLPTLGLVALLYAQAASAAPRIMLQPKSQTVNIASSVTFTIAATNSLPLSYQWQHANTNLAGETNASLLLENVRSNQAGSYRVLVKSSGGAVTSSAATLKLVAGTMVRFVIAGTNVDVALFDHDKPASVQNFLHYIRSGVYSNSFFHRLEPGFVIQGGGFSAPDRGTNAFDISKLADVYSMANSGTDSFAPYIVNEYESITRVRNVFGTLAMARISRPDGGIYTNSASSQWFFNLGDNSTNLDNQYGGFTVFGRVVSGAETLDYFNTLSTNSGIMVITNGNGLFKSLPVKGGGPLQNASLYFANVSFLSTPSFDSKPPGLTMTYPRANVLLTSSNFVMRGKASDSGALAFATCWLVHYPISDAENMAYIEKPITIGPDWTVVVSNAQAGEYYASISAWDGYGNQTNIWVPFTILTPFRLSVVGKGLVTPNLNGKYLRIGTIAPFGTLGYYKLKAIPQAGQVFSHWSSPGGVFARTPEIEFALTTNSGLTATFISNNLVQVAGTYNGLFSPTNGIGATNSGFFTLTVAGSGVYSGRLFLGVKAYSFAGQFGAYGVSQVTVANSITLSLSMAPTNDSGTISGVVKLGGMGVPLFGYRGMQVLSTNTFPAIGQYVLRLYGAESATNIPAGSGYAAVTVSRNGAIGVTGALADNTTLAQKSILSSREGYWPVYGSFYSGKGVCLGWQDSSAGTNIAGKLTWIKPIATSSAFVEAFSTDVSVFGVLFRAPAARTQYQFVFNLGSGWTATNLLNVSASQQFVFQSGLVKSPKISMDARTGIVSGRFSIEGVATPYMFKGAFQNPELGGGGFILNQNRTIGGFEIIPIQ